MTNNINMGIGEIGDPNLVFVRQFRFMIWGEHLSEAYNYSVHINWSKKQIRLATYEVFLDGSIPIHDWADAMESGKYPKESLTFITLDGCGVELYRKVFTGLEIVERENKFDYSKSEVTMHEILLTYADCKNKAIKKDIHKTRQELTAVDHLNAKLHIK
jgi:hypothetical protein